jgi:hypothetical protein
LGADQLDGMGAAAAREPAAKPGCLWFAQTGHNVCNQAEGIGFMDYWQTHGLLDPQLNGYQRSLALFGYPLAEPRVVTNASGDRVLTQWFERARFEYHPTKAQPFNVLLGLMGVERYPDGKFTAPAPCNALATTPSNVAVGAGFCIQWRDSFADEQQFLITLKYLNSGEEFRYSALPNTTQIRVPVSDAPSRATFEQCMRRKDFTLRVEAIRPNTTIVAGEMAGEGECRR